MTWPLAVSTTDSVHAGDRANAEQCAEAWGLPFLVRDRKASLETLWAQADALLLFAPDGVLLRDRQGAYQFHRGMAHLRIHTLKQGGPDRLVQTAELREGDSLLDCTLGLGHDALVAAHVVGTRGRVVGLEKSLALFAVASQGLARHPPGANEAFIDARHVGFQEYLDRQPSGSFDVVSFDPMFEKPRRSQPAFDLLRRFACGDPLTPEVLAEARRVARRWVVVKGARYSTDLKKLGLKPERASRSSTVVFGRISGGVGRSVDAL